MSTLTKQAVNLYSSMSNTEAHKQSIINLNLVSSEYEIIVDITTLPEKIVNTFCDSVISLGYTEQDYVNSFFMCYERNSYYFFTDGVLQIQVNK